MNVSGETIIKSLTESELFEMIDSNMACKSVLVGYVSEQKLIQYLRSKPGFKSISKIPDLERQKGDLLVEYEDKVFTIEVKCMGSSRAKPSIMEGGISGSVCLKSSDLQTTESGDRTSCPPRGQFDILAICLVTVTGNWDFMFMHNKYIPSSSDFPDRIMSTMAINTENTPCLHADIYRVIEDLN